MIMYDPFALDRIRFEQQERQRRVLAPRPERGRSAGRRLTLADALRWRRVAQPCTD